MRIVASNPDAIGDFLLRQPLYRAIQDDGHELLLLVRPAVLPFARMIAPAAATRLIPLDPYRDDPRQCASIELVLNHVREFAPDTFLIAPFQWTRFEEFLAESLPGTAVVGLTGFDFSTVIPEPYCPRSTIQFARQATAGLRDTELEKNRRLAEALLERPVPASRPKLTASPEQLSIARDWLGRQGWSEGSYWLACVGDSPRVAAKNWPAERWAAALDHGARQHGWRYIFVGSEEEQESLQRLRQNLPAPPDAAIVLPTQESTPDRLVGLTALAAGYLGRDTGPMHLAAALDRKILALSTGGDWPRFHPAATIARIYTIDVPCQGCEHACHLAQRYCVREIPVAAVCQGMDDLHQGTTDFQAHALPRDEALARRMEAEAASVARRSLWTVSDLEHRLRASEAPFRHQLSIAQEGWRMEAEARAHESKHAQQEILQLSVMLQERIREIQDCDKLIDQLRIAHKETEELLEVELVRRAQAEQANRDLSRHVQSLLRSRWRRLGRALHLVHPSPFESE